jgi:hypothetical protein
MKGTLLMPLFGLLPLLDFAREGSPDVFQAVIKCRVPLLQRCPDTDFPFFAKNAKNAKLGQITSIKTFIPKAY